MDYKKYIGVIPDFPTKGISFKDISPLLRDPIAFHAAIDELAQLAAPFHPTVILGPEARGFAFGAALAYRMNIGFVMARKKGKLPGHNIEVSYALEYGESVLQVRENSFKKSDRVVIIDDLIATGGSIKACQELVAKCGATAVGAVCVIRLKELAGEKALSIPLAALVDLSASHAD